MKTSFTFSFFTKKNVVRWAATLFFMFLGLQSFAQVTATEDFENESPNNTFSESGINFSYNTFLLYTGSGTYGYANSARFLYFTQSSNTASTTTATISLNTATNPGIGFKINSFAGYISSASTGGSPFDGVVTVTGTAVGATSPVSATINILSATGATRDANGTVPNLNFAGTPLANLNFTSLTFSITDADGGGPNFGVRYFEIDHINFTTTAAVTNQYAISNISYKEGNNGTVNYAYNVTRSLNTSAGSVQIQSSNGSAIAGSDYVALATTVNFTAGGPLTQTVNIGIIGDAIIENDKTFNLTLSNPVNGTLGTATAVVTILDDDENTETFEDETTNAQTFSQNGFNFSSTGSLLVSYGTDIGAGGGLSHALDTRVGNGGSSGNVGSFAITNPSTTFYITKIDVWTSNDDGLHGTTGPVTVTFIGTKPNGTTVSYAAPIAAISGNVFQTINFSGTPLANVQLASIAVVLGSGINYIALDNFKYGTTSLSGTQISINDVKVLEGTGGGTTTAAFTVSRNNNTSAFSVNLVSSDGTATAGSDYIAYPLTTLNFTTGGPLTQTVNITVLHDATAEGLETFNMTLSNATNGTLYAKTVGVGTILDDDKITETFEDEVNNATAFSENSVAFSSSGRLKVLNSPTNGTNSSNFYLSSFPNASGGSVGKITITLPNTAFKLLQLDMLTSKGNPNINAIAVGPVTFTGTRLDGSTVSTTKTITPTSITGSGFQQGITFTGTPLDNVLLTALEFSAGGSITTIDIDNFTYSVFASVPFTEISDASNNVITNGGTATTSNNTDFGTTCIGTPISKTYTIKNTGAVNLTLSGNPLAVVGGTNAGQFSVTTQPTSPIIPGGSTTFTVTYSPNTAATHNATITITSNDGSNSPFMINLKGAANAAVSVATQPSNQIMSGNGTNGLGNATFSISASNATYQWQIKNGASYTNLTNTTPYSGVTSNTLIITNPPISTLNNAVYRCVLTGTSPCSGANSNDVSLTIVSPSGTLPSGTLTGTDITTGVDAGWTLYAAGANVGFGIQWNGNASAKASATITTINGSPTSATTTYPQKAVYAMGRYWNVTTSSALSSPVNVRFFYTLTDRSTATTNATNYATTNGLSDDGFKWFKTVGSAYNPAVNVTSSGITGNSIILSGSESSVNGVGQVQFTGITSFSGGSGEASSGNGSAILPIDLLYFTAAKWDDKSVNITWATTSEKASANFLVERSINGVDFTTLTTVKSQGDISTGRNYSYLDVNPTVGTNYYRLSEISVDGSITRFPIKTVSFYGSDALVKIYPNPVKGQRFYVDITNGDVTSIDIKTITGQLITASFSKLSNSLFEVNANSNLTAGIYLVTIKKASGNELTQRLLVK